MMVKPAVCSVHAPAKINLHLEIKERLPNGFHELQSLFVSLDFGDDLRFETTEKPGFWELELRCPPDSPSNLSPELGEFRDNLEVGGLDEFCDNADLAFLDDFRDNNLITRAVSLFRAKTGFDKGLKCTLDKRIPLGAGLGGGSSDAVSTLLALDLLAGTKLSIEELLEIAENMGSDLPFFLHGGAAWVSGRGERIETLIAPPKYGVILVKPPFQSATGEAYRLLDQYREQNALKNAGSMPHFATFQPKKPTPKDVKSAWLLSPETWPFSNDFLDVLPQSDVYNEILQDLRDSGALFAGLSGSGSCCFGVYKDSETALAAKNALKKSQNKQFNIFCTFFLASRAVPVLQL